MELVSKEEYIIRRVPPSSDKMIYSKVKADSPNARKRATSAALFRRQGELGLSCSRLSITSPIQLLSQVNLSFLDGWEVSVWRVGDLPEGLSVVITPSDPPELDRGHCEIRSPDFSKRLLSKLAYASTILTLDQLVNIKAGDIPELD
jgi:hypothetical protein